MPRRPRLRLAGVPLHIIQRGNDRAACFLQDSDRLVYLAQLALVARRFECSVHAYVLMTNHVHLLVTPGDHDSASLMMKHLGQRYVQYFNRAHDRSGTLWEGRFKSCLIHSEAYLLACHRYIELNPVRAGLVSAPGDYPWSSFGANAGGEELSFLVTHDELQHLGATPVQRSAAYRALFEDHLDPAVIGAIRDATNGNVVLGDRDFQADIESRLGRRTWRGKPGRPRGEPASGPTRSLPLTEPESAERRAAPSAPTAK
jgi:putative transposase